jgi:hypothetical protein
MPVDPIKPRWRVGLYVTDQAGYGGFPLTLTVGGRDEAHGRANARHAARAYGHGIVRVEVESIERVEEQP